MGDQLDKQIHPDQDAEWRQERCVMAESDGGKRMRRHQGERWIRLAGADTNEGRELGDCGRDVQRWSVLEAQCAIRQRLRERAVGNQRKTGREKTSSNVRHEVR